MSEMRAMPEEFKMPVLKNNISRIPTGLPDWVFIPDGCEEQAQKNHQQSLTRLKERGGLDPSELLAVIELRSWRQMSWVEIVRGFEKYHWI